MNKVENSPGRENRTSGKSEPDERFPTVSISAFQRFRVSAFTLIELLVVITIIIILIGLLFPVFSGAQNQARKVQAKNDLIQIVTAVNAFFADYGVYPIAPGMGGNSYDVEYGNPDSPQHSNSEVMNALRAINDQNGGPNAGNALNPRQVTYFGGSPVKDANNPRGGFDSKGEFWDPWGSPSGPSSTIGHYIINIDASYDSITQAYTLGNYHDLTYDTSAGGNGVRAGVIAASLGKDGSYGTVQGTAPSGDYIFKGSDDVLSWQ